MYQSAICENNITWDQPGYTKVIDCDWRVLKSDNCDLEIYMKINPGNIDFYVKTILEGYKIFIYDKFGRKIMDKDLNISRFNKDGLSSGLYFIKVTNGIEVYTKRINL